MKVLIAEEKPGQDISGMYRKYTIRSATKDDFFDYLLSFKDDYEGHHFSFGAMDGTYIIYKDDVQEQNNE